MFTGLIGNAVYARASSQGVNNFPSVRGKGVNGNKIGVVVEKANSSDQLPLSYNAFRKWSRHPLAA